MSTKQLNSIRILVTSLLIAGSDQLTKYLALKYLTENNTLTLIKGLIKLNLTKNTGAAFSLFTQYTSLLTIISFSVTIFLIIWIRNNEPFKISDGLCLSFLLAGTIGNGIDRLRMGFVVDFIEFIPINFPIFNVADISINIALAILIINTIIKK